MFILITMKPMNETISFTFEGVQAFLPFPHIAKLKPKHQLQLSWAKIALF